MCSLDFRGPTGKKLVRRAQEYYTDGEVESAESCLGWTLYCHPRNTSRLAARRWVVYISLKKSAPPGDCYPGILGWMFSHCWLQVFIDPCLTLTVFSSPLTRFPIMYRCWWTDGGSWIGRGQAQHEPLLGCGIGGCECLSLNWW